MRGWLLCKFAGLDVDVVSVPSTDESSRAELMLLSPSFLVPRLQHGDVTVWDTMAIAEYVHELVPSAGVLPTDRAARARCRAICGEMHSGFANLRSALPMNLKARHPEFPMWAGAKADIDRILEIWRECLDAVRRARTSSAPSRPRPTRCTRRSARGSAPTTCSSTSATAAYRDTILGLPAMVEWAALAASEPDEIEELDVEF